MVKPYRELREVIDKKDRGLRDKVMSLEEAIGMIKDGDHVAAGGCHYSKTPMISFTPGALPPQRGISFW
jgi:glutaconate CoA-transferase subunit A